MTTTIGARIKALRERRGLSQRALAYLAKVRQPSLSDLERGKTISLRSGTLERLADALGVTIDVLLRGNDTPQAPAPQVDISVRMIVDVIQQLSPKYQKIVLVMARSLRLDQQEQERPRRKSTKKKKHG